MQNQSQSTLRQENAALRTQVDQIAALQAENAQLSNQLAQATGGGGPVSGDQMRELVKLRGEVGVLRSQIAKLQGQAGELQKLRQENSALRDRPAQAAAAAAPAPPQVDPEAAKAQCINQMRVIEDCKQRYASEHDLHATDSVSAEQIMPCLTQIGYKEFPKCPLGGSYNIGIMAVKCSCSTPGHVLQ